MIDPPWPQRKGGLRKVAPNQTRQLDYSTMPVDDIFVLLDELWLPHANTVFLWAIDKFLFQAEESMKSRRFHLHARLVWDKGNGVAPAFTVRFTHEYLLWFYRKPMQPIAISMRGKLPTIMREPARGHSRKPEIAYSLIESLYPDQEKADIFSRQSHEGWIAWGNEAGKFD